jgi:hypothetical protein
MNTNIKNMNNSMADMSDNVSVMNNSMSGMRYDINKFTKPENVMMPWMR